MWWTRHDSPAGSEHLGETGKEKEIPLDDVNVSARLTKITSRDENNDAEKGKKDEKCLDDQDKALGSEEVKSNIVIIG